VEDYVTFAPKQYPDSKYELWGSELELVKPEAYPLRTYVEFEHKLSMSSKNRWPLYWKCFPVLVRGSRLVSDRC
jgi:hypothetical protein